MAGEEKWMKRQRRQGRLFTNFCNAKLCDRDDVPPVTDIFEDIKDGRLLYALLEELSGQSLAPLGKVKTKGKGGKPMTRIDHVANLSISFRYIKQTTKIVGIGPGDIADGNPGLILGLMWSIIVFFTAKDLGGIDDVSALKKKILKWCQKRTENNTDVDVRNLKDSFMGGRAFLAILNDVDPSFTYAPSSNARSNFKEAFKEAADRYGVPELLDGDDEDCWKDEQGMVTYLSEMYKRMPERAEDISPALMKWIDDHVAETTDDLKTICAIPSIPSDPSKEGECIRCAETIANFMRRDGLGNVEVVPYPGGAPFVLASSPKFDKTLPTVLFVASYGVDDPSGLAWAFDPFAPEVVDGRLRAAGSASAKAGTVQPAKALAAIAAAVPEGERVPVNLEILLTCGKQADYEQGGRIEKFTASIYGTDSPDARPQPHYALVDTPGAASIVAPGKFGVIFACRGEVCAEVKVVLTSGSKPVLPAQNVAGPLLDANLALAVVASSLRKPDTALLNVPGLLGFPEPNRFTKAVSNVNHIEARQLATSAAYPAPPHRLASLPASKWSIVEQLCFHPGVSVVDFAPPADPKHDDTAFVGASSTMTVFANLAPAFTHEDGLTALRSALETAAPWDCQLELSPRSPAHTGFLSEISPHFLSKVTEAASKRFSQRGAALTASPSYLESVSPFASLVFTNTAPCRYLPLPTAISRALPRVATYGCGVADTKANIGAAEEGVTLEDVVSTIKTFVQLILNLKGMSKQHFGKVDASQLYNVKDCTAGAHS